MYSIENFESMILGADRSNPNCADAHLNRVPPYLSTDTLNSSGAERLLALAFIIAILVFSV